MNSESSVCPSSWYLYSSDSLTCHCDLFQCHAMNESVYVGTVVHCNFQEKVALKASGTDSLLS